jgi:hypothetical protein
MDTEIAEFEADTILLPKIRVIWPACAAVVTGVSNDRAALYLQFTMTRCSYVATSLITESSAQ